MKESVTRDSAGNTYVRRTTDDGRRSYLYKLGPLGGEYLVEISDHHRDGTTDAYEPGGLIDHLFWGGRGRRK